MSLVRRNATVAIVGAGDHIGAAIAHRFAAEGHTIVSGRRTADKLTPLVTSIAATGGRCIPQTLDARQEDQITAFITHADCIAPLELCTFNVDGNVQFSLLDSTERVFRRVWERACYGGFLTGREAARAMLPRGRGSIFFTGATVSLRGSIGYVAFASAKAGLRATAQSMARELGPRNIHVAHLVIDAGVDTEFVRARIAASNRPERLTEPDRLLNPSSIGETYWHLHLQTRYD